VALKSSLPIPAELLTDPTKFQQAFLRRRLWSKQREINTAIATRRHVAVKGCHASGKTFDASGLVLWWLQRWDRGIVVQVSPTMRQVKTFWNEVATASMESEIRFPEVTTAGMSIARNRYGIGMSSSRGVNVQGFHGDKVLIIADEAPGIEEDIWDAIEGIRAGGEVTLLELGNPTVPSGHFYDSFHRGRHTCETITISAFDSPNLEGLTLATLNALPDDQLDIAVMPYLTQRRWVKEFTQKWGKDHPKVRARVFGEFPEQATNAVFPLAWVERAALPYESEDLDKLPDRSEIRWAVDVAGPGDDHTSICAQVEGFIVHHESFTLADPRGAIAGVLGRLRIRPELRRFRLGRGLVDTVGIGYHVATHLADLHFDVFGFVANARPRDQQQFSDAKSEAYWNFRLCLEARYVRGLTDEDAQAQLSDILYSENSRGQTEIESKADMKKRRPGASSPDEAEAAIMAFAPIVIERESHAGYEATPISPI
jgi:hypothetical protein